MVMNEVLLLNGWTEKIWVEVKLLVILFKLHGFIKPPLKLRIWDIFIYRVYIYIPIVDQ